MICNGIDPHTGGGVQVAFARFLTLVSPGDPTDLYISPGFIDLQVNGFAGVDYNDPHSSHAAIARSIHALFATGVTRFYPTVITGAPEDMLAALSNLALARRSISEGIAMDGFHVEGPHLCAEDGPRGVHPRRWIRPPDLDEFRRWQDATGGLIRIVTIAPEWPEAAKYIERVTASGTVISIGHTNATAQQIQDAVSAGATLSTHLGNAALGMMRKHPNCIWEQLAEDRLMAGFIVDGIHLGPAFLKAALRAKTLDRAMLVTDAAAPAGCTPGQYQLGEIAVELTGDQRVVLRGGDRLAGSALRMDRGVENLMRMAGLSLAEAISLATTNPARAGRVDGRTAGLVAGDRADLIQYRFEPDSRSIQILATYLSGELVFQSA